MLLNVRRRGTLPNSYLIKPPCGATKKPSAAAFSGRQAGCFLRQAAHGAPLLEVVVAKDFIDADRDEPARKEEAYDDEAGPPKVFVHGFHRVPDPAAPPDPGDAAAGR